MTDPPPGEVTDLLHKWQDPLARNQLFSVIYPQLKRIAAQRMAREKSGHPLQPTALVHELFLVMVRQEARTWNNRAHFLAAASASMRRLLVDHARASGSKKRGGQIDWLTLDAEQFGVTPDFEQALILDDLLTKFVCQDPRASQVVELRCFGGLTFNEIASLLQIHPRTAKRDWALAITWFNSSFAGEAHA